VKVDKKKWMDFIDDEANYSVGAGGLFCPLCSRPYDETMDQHHLTPKLKKGKETVTLHKICHRKIHSLFAEQELAQHYNTIEKLLENEDIQKFVKWVQKKPRDYLDSNRLSNNRKGK